MQLKTFISGGDGLCALPGYCPTRHRAGEGKAQEAARIQPANTLIGPHSCFLQGPFFFFFECLCSLGHLGNHNLVGMGLFILIFLGHQITFLKDNPRVGLKYQRSCIN